MLIETAHATINLDVNLAVTIMVGVAGGMIIHYAFVATINTFNSLAYQIFGRYGNTYGENNNTVNGPCPAKSEPQPRAIHPK